MIIDIIILLLIVVLISVMNRERKEDNLYQDNLINAFGIFDNKINGLHERLDGLINKLDRIIEETK